MCNQVSKTLPEEGSFCQGKGSRRLHRDRSKDSAEGLQQLPNEEGWKLLSVGSGPYSQGEGGLICPCSMFFSTALKCH